MSQNLLNLTVGSELKLDSISDVTFNNLHSELIGYTRGESLIIAHPKKDNTPVHIKPGEKFMVGVEHSEEEVCFETMVVAILDEPYPHLHTTYPESVRSGSIRQSSRVTAAPANIRIVEEDGTFADTQISLLNVSTSGAGLVVDRKVGEVNDIFEIDVQLGGDESNSTFTCMIRYVHEVSKDNQPKFNHGVVFIGMDAETQLFLWRYFQESAAIHSGQKIS